MPIQAEVLLLAAMVGLYLYDSARLLHANEGVLMASLGGRWSLHFGAEHFTLRGKEPFVPHPLLPHRPLYPFQWKQQVAAGAGVGAAAGPAARPARYS